MSTIPTYNPATLPLGDTDTIYIEQGSGADRGKRTTMLGLLNKVAYDFGAVVASQGTDTAPAVGDFLAAENGGIGKKIPVESLEFAPTVKRLPYTGAKSFQMYGSTGVGSLVDNLVDASTHADTALIDEGHGRLELIGTFKYVPSSLVSSARQVSFVLSDPSDPYPDILVATLVGILTARGGLAVSFPMAARSTLDGTTKTYAASLASGGTSLIMALYQPDTGAKLLYSDLYLASVPGDSPVYLDFDVRIFT